MVSAERYTGLIFFYVLSPFCSLISPLLPSFVWLFCPPGIPFWFHPHFLFIGFWSVCCLPASAVPCTRWLWIGYVFIAFDRCYLGNCLSPGTTLRVMKQKQASMLVLGERGLRADQNAQPVFWEWDPYCAPHTAGDSIQPHRLRILSHKAASSPLWCHSQVQLITCASNPRAINQRYSHDSLLGFD